MQSDQTSRYKRGDGRSEPYSEDKHGPNEWAKPEDVDEIGEVEALVERLCELRTGSGVASGLLPGNDRARDPTVGQIARYPGWLSREDGQLPDCSTWSTPTTAKDCGVIQTLEQIIEWRGKSQENGYVERYNRTVRYDWLNQHLFRTIDQVRGYATRWLWTYNSERTNMVLGGITPKQKVALVAWSLLLKRTKMGELPRLK